MSFMDPTSFLTTMPSAPKLLSSWKICLVGTPLAFHTIQVSTVVAAHWMSPDWIARWRLACGTFLIVTSRPFFLKMPASLASVRGAKPVQPEMPTATFVSCAEADPAASANTAKPPNTAFIAASVLSKFPGSLCRPDPLEDPGSSRRAFLFVRANGTMTERQCQMYRHYALPLFWAPSGENDLLC